MPEPDPQQPFIGSSPPYLPPPGPVPPYRPATSPYETAFRRPNYPIGLLVVGIIIIAIFLVPYLAQQIAFAIARGQELARAEVARKELQGLAAAANRYALVAKIVEPSVVGIQTTVPVVSPFGDAGFFEPEIQETTQGSGVIVDPAGYILTNAHVLSQAAEGGVTVQLSDGRTIDRATIVGVDPATDLAVLKIDVGQLTAAQWGDSAALEVGDPVLAVGSPYGLTETVTAGIISAKNRHMGIEHVRYEDFLQTDAAINPGNSGGPLVNMDAQIVGINTAIIGHGNQGIGFAIPSDLAKKVYELLRTSGISRGWIGAGVQNLTKSLAEKFGLKDTHGALVAQVFPNSPADKAGMKAGDVIVAWDKQPIVNANDLRIAAARTEPGQKAQVAFYRNGKKQDVTITTAQRPNKLAQ